jgi:hypothetical protein
LLSNFGKNQKEAKKNYKDLGDFFGGVSGALITMMYNRVARQAEQNRRMKRRIARIKKQIFNT